MGSIFLVIRIKSIVKLYNLELFTYFFELSLKWNEDDSENFYLNYIPNMEIEPINNLANSSMWLIGISRVWTILFCVSIGKLALPTNRRIHILNFNEYAIFFSSWSLHMNVTTWCDCNKISDKMFQFFKDNIACI